MKEVYDFIKACGTYYSATDENTEVLYFKNATATISSFAAAPKEIKF